MPAYRIVDFFKKAPPRWSCIAAASMALSGCVNFEPSPDSTRFYVLASGGAPASSSAGVNVAVQRVSLPEHLESSGLVVRQGANEIRYHTRHRWSGSLDAMIAGAVAEGLGRARSDLNVTTEPVGVASRRLSIRILRFEAWADGAVEVSFDWSLTTPNADVAVQSGRIVQRGSWDGGDLAALVEELSALLQAAAGELAEALQVEQSGSP